MVLRRFCTRTDTCTAHLQLLLLFHMILLLLRMAVMLAVASVWPCFYSCCFCMAVCLLLLLLDGLAATAVSTVWCCACSYSLATPTSAAAATEY